MTLVVVGHRPGATLLHRQAGLSAVERLDLALLIDREDYGMGGRIDIQADDVAQLAHKLRVGGDLNCFTRVRLKAVRTPNALDGTRADIDDLRHHGGSPMGRLCWRVGLGERHDALDDVRSQPRDARWPRFVPQETVITFLHAEAFLPAPEQLFHFPVRRMISLVPTPSALNRTISARQTACAGRCDPPRAPSGGDDQRA